MSKRHQPPHITGKAYALRRDGTRVLYRCLRHGHEEWYDFAKDPRYRSHPKKRRLEIGENNATLAARWHSEAKGGGYVECAACLKMGRRFFDDLVKEPKA